MKRNYIFSDISLVLKKFDWRDWLNPQEISVRMSSVPAEQETLGTHILWLTVGWPHNRINRAWGIKCSQREFVLYPTMHYAINNKVIPGMFWFIRPAATDQSVDSNFLHYVQ